MFKSFNSFKPIKSTDWEAEKRLERLGNVLNFFLVRTLNRRLTAVPLVIKAAVVEALLIGTTTTNAATTVTQSASAAQQGTFLTSSSSSGIVRISGICTTRGSGTANISIQHLKVTSGTSTVKIGSYLKIRLLN